jgi:hypothetical protein
VKSRAQAYAAGIISARRADILLYLCPEEQRAAIAKILAEREAAKRRSRIAAEVIRGYVTAGRRDLVALQKDLRLALSPSSLRRQRGTSEGSPRKSPQRAIAFSGAAG